ncbi:unnamed protein product [Lampetra fluviatilis]
MRNCMAFDTAWALHHERWCSSEETETDDHGAWTQCTRRTRRTSRQDWKSECLGPPPPTPPGLWAPAQLHRLRTALATPMAPRAVENPAAALRVSASTTPGGFKAALREEPLPVRPGP